MIFDKHIFICCNERKNNEKPSCGESFGLQLVAEFKKEIAAQKLPIKIRAQKAGCLDICYHGPTVAIYPEGTFYIGVTLRDVKEIVEEHIKNNRPVKRLVLESFTKR